MGSLSLAGQAILLPTWEQAVAIAASFAFIFGVGWLVHRTDRLVHSLFPFLEWEQSLGWLNIRAQRRAEAALRALGYAIQLLLAVSLLGFVWAAEALPTFRNWPDPWVMGELALRLPVLLFCSGIWLVYFGAWLLPKWKAERELRGLKLHRARLRADEPEHERRAPRTPIVPLLKPRPAIPLAPRRVVRRGR